MPDCLHCLQSRIVLTQKRLYCVLQGNLNTISDYDTVNYCEHLRTWSSAGCQLVGGCCSVKAAGVCVCVEDTNESVCMCVSSDLSYSAGCVIETTTTLVEFFPVAAGTLSQCFYHSSKASVQTNSTLAMTCTAQEECVFAANRKSSPLLWVFVLSSFL